MPFPSVLPPLPPGIRTLSGEETDRLRRRYPDLQRSLNDCLTCRGAKSFQAREQLTGDIEKWSCPCEDQFVLHRALLHAGIDLRYQRLSWADCVGVEDVALALVLDYAEQDDRYIAEGLGLVLHGNKGTGKTLLVTLLLKKLLGQGHNVYLVTFQELIDVYTQSWRDADEKAWLTRRIVNAGILGIDDIGREHKGRSEVVEAMMDHVVRSRVASSRPTLVTTNRSMEEFTTLYRSNVMSLLSESAIDFHFTGEDFRPQAKDNRVRDAREGVVRPIVLG